MTVPTLSDQRQIILSFWNQGKRTAKEIHTVTKIPLPTIYYNLRKIKKLGTNKQLKRTGRPKVVTKELAQKIRRRIEKNPYVSTRSLVIELGEVISQPTLVRYLKTAGYKNDISKTTPMLTSLHKQKRLEWAKNHLNDSWTNTFFSDETAFQLFRNTVGQWYKGPRPVRRIPKDRRKILAWGGFCKKGKTDLFCFRETMTAEVYVDILEKNIADVKILMGKKWRFQQDNDPKHTSRLAKSYLEVNMPEVLDWPSCSPDLNPIENIWSLVKRNVEKRMPRNLTELEAFLKEEWNLIPNNILNDLVMSMRNRCEKVIRNNGDFIDY
jgi:transposase